MNKISILLCFLFPLWLISQSYAPPAGQEGTTAIHKDSAIIVGWASGIEVIRGYLNIEDKDYEIDGSNKASFGEPENALGYASGNSADIVSLGDSGVAILTFEHPIMNGPGYDFAVFENSFSDDYLELAHVEVSSNGEHYVRFPSHSEVQTTEQTGGFGSTDARKLYNLAGKYRAAYGTPFDLEELKDSAGIDIDNITHVKLIDVVGSIGEGGTNDSFGNRINEPFPTPFESGGFDLDAVGVMHQFLNINTHNVAPELVVYPNPSDGNFTISVNKLNEPTEVFLYDIYGQLVLTKQLHEETLKLNRQLSSGTYFLKTNNPKYGVKKLIVN